MPQRNPEHCTRCSPTSVCTAHEAYATPERPTAASLLAGTARGADLARSDVWRVEGTGNPGNVPTHD